MAPRVIDGCQPILCKCLVNLDRHRLRFSQDSFYKNIVLYMTQFWVCIEDLYLSVYELNSNQYSFFNFSGQIVRVMQV